MTEPSPAAELTGIPDDLYVEPLNPVDWEAEMHRTRLRIAKGIRIVSDRRKIAAKATRAANREHARAYVRAQGAQYERRYIADTDPRVIELQDAADVAEASYHFARDVLQELRDDLTALQSIGKSVISMYSSENGRG